MTGDSADGPFKLVCAEFWVKANSGRDETPAWSIAKPSNCMVTISYGEARPIAKVVATINNFDFKFGNSPALDCESGSRTVLRVEAAGRHVDFVWRPERERLRRLLDSDLLRSTALTTFSFSAWSGASEQELIDFAQAVASLCSIVARQHTTVPVLTLEGENGRPVKRVVGDAIESEFRTDYLFRWPHLDKGFPRLFRECFVEHQRMQQSRCWRRLPWFCASIEDPPYLEQKLASLMSAVEMVIRSSLVEAGHYAEVEAADLSLPKLLGAARNRLGWDVPKHYTERDRHRKLRNAAAHGDELPGDIAEVRRDFDKWSLFLSRRVLMRLGFQGQVSCPEEGFASNSPVTDFSEKHNDFR